MLGAKLIENCLDTGDAAEAATLRARAVSTRRRELIQMGMDIIDVDEGYRRAGLVRGSRIGCRLAGYSHMLK